jgi:beta-lactamase class A
MRYVRRRPTFGLLTVAAAAGVVAPGFVVSTAPPAGASSAAAKADSSICTSAKDPALAAKISNGVTAALRSRTDSTVGLAVADARDGLTCKLHWASHFDAASVIKVTIISALLLKEGGPSGLTSEQRSLAWLMITQSDDDAATALWNDVGGVTGMQVFLNKAGMSHTDLNYAWGLTLLTAQDELRLLDLLVFPNKVLSTASRVYVLYLMKNVTPSQRWGVPAGAPKDITVHVKNGWLPYPDTNLNADDWHINSIGTFNAHDINYEIVILTDGEQSEGYGIDTVQAAAEVINKDVAADPAENSRLYAPTRSIPRAQRPPAGNGSLATD